MRLVKKPTGLFSLSSGMNMPLAFVVSLTLVCHSMTQARAQTAQSTWKELIHRFEQAVDAVEAEVREIDTIPAPLIGIFIPPSPELASAMPSRWVPLSAVPQAHPHMVLLIHGLDEPGDIWSDLAPELVQAGYRVGRFEYPNDQSVEASAVLLLKSLRDARLMGVNEVSLIAHSMGGLVAFDALTRTDGYAGVMDGGSVFPRVVRLTTVGTPWTGSPWARLRIVAEIREQAQRWYMEESWNLKPLLQYKTDGLGGAGDDLSEGSPLIRKLLARPVPAELSMTVIAGRMVESETDDLSWVRESTLLRGVLGSKRVHALVQDLAEAGRTLGDGVVPIDSALARAGDDQAVLEANHRGLIRRTPIDRGPSETKPPAIAIILDRLEADRKSTKQNVDKQIDKQNDE